MLGKEGRNYVLAPAKQVLRAAPEQVRAATSEEIGLLTAPNAELLGIKDLIEGGAFESQQYIDWFLNPIPRFLKMSQIPRIVLPN